MSTKHYEQHYSGDGGQRYPVLVSVRTEPEHSPSFPVALHLTVKPENQVGGMAGVLLTPDEARDLAVSLVKAAEEIDGVWPDIV